jgi:hypothetical protein
MYHRDGMIPEASATGVAVFAARWCGLALPRREAPERMAPGELERL